MQQVVSQAIIDCNVDTKALSGGLAMTFIKIYCHMS